MKTIKMSAIKENESRFLSAVLENIDKMKQFRLFVKGPKSRKKYIIIWLCLFINILIVRTIFDHSIFSSKVHRNNKYNINSNSYAKHSFSNSCKIANVDPFSKEVMGIFNRWNFRNCSNIDPLTSIEQRFDTDEAFLLIHEDRKKNYLAWWQKNFQCCYQQITRSGFNKTADKEIHSSTCKTFQNGHRLKPDEEFIVVTCRGSLWKFSSKIYVDGHAMIRSKESVRQRLKIPKGNKINVFMMGIDSVSRLNLIRGMPNTYTHLKQNKWFDLRGYNKVGDNTFPNLMAILTGKRESEVEKTCNWKKVGELEKCNFMWNEYKNAGYVTAYAEDEAKINTFNYYETGFIQPPTDYYLRPFNLAIEEKLKIVYEKKLKFCIGYQHYVDYIYNYGLDFAQKYSNDSFFGFFWTNSFSHEDLSMVSAMDGRVKYYLENLESRGVLNSSIVMFFSDHGMRFGPIRKTFTGWLEERMPFFFVWLPPAFQKAHPDIVEALKINQNRLTSPFDVHVTLKHILKLSGGFDKELSAISCPGCQSLFTELALNRSCPDAGIDSQWCACESFEVIDATSKIVKLAVEKIVKQINSDLKPHSKCSQLKLKKINSARKSNFDYLVTFSVSPSDAELEATIRCIDQTCKKYEILGSVSRLNRYGDQSRCVNDSNLRKYCFCME